MKKLIFITIIIAATLTLTKCSSIPTNIENACTILDEKDGFFDSWSNDLRKVEAKYNIPASIILATIYVESKFDANAKPKRRKLLGFIPWKRRSTAYGYAQVLDGTWSHYIKANHLKHNPKRTNFADAVDFIGWYYNQTVKRNKISRTDAYNLYLNYYMGQGAYAKNKNAVSPKIKQAAHNVKKWASTYEKQLYLCGKI